MVSQPSVYFWKECGFQIFLSICPIHELCLLNNIKWNFNAATLSNFYVLVFFFLSDSQFPIDITPVKRDHDFLDKDLVEPLCR